ncbi:putative lipoprotein ybaY [Beauveria bassiana D1-5]|uniref:Putative lipoprotein ybaY n=1 Tax=Beauveria bassiana D1-5 TaxID=1245745 RepID=A0A0A2WDL8_BEABA|nr:putative lipoprotein ybaY [Beauveria bassiana D1-5]
MKLVPMLSALAIAVAVAGCSHKSADVPTPAPSASAGAASAQQSNIALPNVSGTAWIRQRVALPPDAVLTVTVSDASLADAPSKVIAQKVTRTEGKQAPFSFVIPFNPADIQPNARILLSAAITVDGRDEGRPDAGPGTKYGYSASARRWGGEHDAIHLADSGNAIFCGACANNVLKRNAPEWGRFNISSGNAAYRYARLLTP